MCIIISVLSNFAIMLLHTCSNNQCNSNKQSDSWSHIAVVISSPLTVAGAHSVTAVVTAIAIAIAIAIVTV